MFDLHAPDHMQVWVEQTDAIRAAGGVGWSEANGGYWVVVNHADAIAAAKNWQVFSARHDPTGADPRARGISIPPYEFALILSESDPPRQQKLRLLEIPFFQPSRIREQVAVVQGHVDSRLEAMAGMAEIDLFRDYAMPLVSLTSMALVGIDLAHWQDYTLAAHRGGAATSLDITRDTERVHAMLLDMARDRRANPRQDIASALVTGDVMGEKLRDEEVVSMLSALVLGGFDTTSSLVTSALIWLGANREHHAELASNDALAANAVHEFARMWPPSLGGARNLVVDTVLGGQAMKDGDRVFLSWAAANRDPDVFADPHTVRLDRPNAQDNLTFGMGVHRCLGMELARLMTRLAIQSLLRRHPHFRVIREQCVPYRSKGLVAGWSAVPAVLG
jgi:cytochrome P450